LLVLLYGSTGVARKARKLRTVTRVRIPLGSIV
jgi:hypothetical protein